MPFLLFPLAILLLVVVRSSSPQDIYFQNVIHSNNSVILIEDIGEDDESITCHTTFFACCKRRPLGEWHYPDGRIVPKLSEGEDFYRNRDDNGNVRLHKRNDVQGPTGTFYCIIPNHRGEIVRLNVNVFRRNDYPAVTRHPQPQLNVDPGSNVSFSVMADRSSSYHWRHNGDLLSSVPSKYVGTRHQVLTILRVGEEDVGAYSCVVGNRILSVLSEQASLSLLAPPVIIAEPKSMLEVQEGAIITLSLDAEGLRLTFSWQRTDGEPLAANTRVEGADTSVLRIRVAEVGDSGGYVCLVTNAAGTVRSKEVTVSVDALEVEKEVDRINSISITASITSAQVAWVQSNSSSNILYELQYFPVLFPSHITTLNTTLKSHDAIGLVPLLQYQFQVRCYAESGRGEWVGTEAILDKKIPAVQNLSLSITSITGVIISWAPPPDPLPGWNISYYYITYRALDTKQDNRLVTTFTDRVKDGRTSEMMSADRLLVDVEGVVHEFEVVAVLKIEGLEGIGEVKGETANISTYIQTDEVPFQLMIGPVSYCVNWEPGKSDSIQGTLHKALQEGIRTHCNCSLERNPIGRGIFSCRGSKNVVTYRSTVRSLNSTETLSYIQDWVSSNVTILHDWYLVDIFSSCPTKVAKLDEPECQL